MSQTETSQPEWAIDPIKEAEIQACAEAGASRAFIEVLRTDTPRGVNRHSVREEVKKQLREWGKDPDEMTDLAGHFFTHLWNGNYDYYTGHADSNNQAILEAAGFA